MKKILGIIIFTSLFLCNYSFGQIKLSIGPIVGYTSPASDLSGSTMDYYSGAKYGLNGAVNFGAQAKVKLLIVNFKGSVMYTSLNNSGNSEPGQGSIENNLKLLTFGLGTEFHLPLPLVPVNPYISLEYLLTNFSGETVFQGVSRVPSGTYTMESASRSGLGIGVGAEISFGKKITMDLGLRYNAYNLFSKSNSGGDDRLSSYTSLNDEADPLNSSNPDMHPVAGSRSISAVQFNLSFLFDF